MAWLNTLIFGALWGLAEVYLWHWLAQAGVGFKAPIITGLALGLLVFAGGERPLRGLAAAAVALVVKAALGVHFLCAIAAVALLGAWWELARLLASRLPRWWFPVVAGLSAPLAMLSWALVFSHPSKIVDYALVGGSLAYALGLPLMFLGLWLEPKLLALWGVKPEAHEAEE